MSTDINQTLKVLIVDDDDDVREISLMSLEYDAGMSARAVSSGREGLVVARQWQPDVMLIDVVMPELDGPGTVEQLKLDPQTRDIPVIFLTARSQTTEISAFMALGIAGVISKPFDPLALPKLVREHVAALLQAD